MHWTFFKHNKHHIGHTERYPQRTNTERVCTITPPAVENDVQRGPGASVGDAQQSGALGGSNARRNHANSNYRTLKTTEANNRVAYQEAEPYYTQAQYDAWNDGSEHVRSEDNTQLAKQKNSAGTKPPKAALNDHTAIRHEPRQQPQGLSRRGSVQNMPNSRQNSIHYCQHATGRLCPRDGVDEATCSKHGHYNRHDTSQTHSYSGHQYPEIQPAADDRLQYRNEVPEFPRSSAYYQSRHVRDDQTSSAQMVSQYQHLRNENRGTGENQSVNSSIRPGRSRLHCPDSKIDGAKQLCLQLQEVPLRTIRNRVVRARIQLLAQWDEAWDS